MVSVLMGLTVSPVKGTDINQSSSNHRYCDCQRKALVRGHIPGELSLSKEKRQASLKTCDDFDNPQREEEQEA